jgi:hypothetical protein
MAGIDFELEIESEIEIVKFTFLFYCMMGPT